MFKPNSNSFVEEPQLSVETGDSQLEIPTQTIGQQIEESEDTDIANTDELLRKAFVPAAKSSRQ